MDLQDGLVPSPQQSVHLAHCGKRTLFYCVVPLIVLLLTVTVCILGQSRANDQPPPTRSADPSTPHQVAATYIESKFRQKKAQMESVEFLWTPGELVRQSIEEQSVPCYPDN